MFFHKWEFERWGILPWVLSSGFDRAVAKDPFTKSTFWELGWCGCTSVWVDPVELLKLEKSEECLRE